MQTYVCKPVDKCRVNTDLPPFLSLLLLSHLPLLHVVHRGVPKQLPLTKVPGIQFLKNLSNLLFLCRLASMLFSQHPLPKNALPSSLLINPKILFRSFFRCSFSPFLNKCQLLMPKDFLEPPCLTLLGVSLVYGRGRGETDNEHSNPILLPLVPEFTNIWISHLQFLHF